MMRILQNSCCPATVSCHLILIRLLRVSTHSLKELSKLSDPKKPSMNLNGSNVLVTGGAGHIGSHLAEHLVRQGANVRVVDNLERGRLENIQHLLDKIEFVRADLRIQKNAEDAVEGIDIVFHLAAKLGGIEYMNPEAGSQSEIYDSNILMNTMMLQAARKFDVDRYLYCS